MISPELLRRYKFFGPLNESQLKSIAMNSEEESYASGTIIFEEGQSAQNLYFLIEGSMELFFSVEPEIKSGVRKEFHVGDINPGEIFGISALIEPYTLTLSTRARSPARVIRINAEALRSLCHEDSGMGCVFLKQVSKAAMERLNATRVQLAAATA
jgi:CRP-like cAMP-binding protein